jgi:uncharacterized protein (TIGR03086 family)
MTCAPLMPDLSPAAQEAKRVLSSTTAAQLSAPTPCAGYTVAAMLDHFMGLTIAFTEAARKTAQSDAGAPAGPLQASAQHLDPDWRRKIPVQLDALVAAWRGPSAWQGNTVAEGVTLPAHIMGVVALDELIIHGWDLARATGQPYQCDTASAEAIIQFLSQFADNRGKGTGFGPVVEVAANASLLDRAVGLSGRDPSWTP